MAPAARGDPFALKIPLSAGAADELSEDFTGPIIPGNAVEFTIRNSP